MHNEVTGQSLTGTFEDVSGFLGHGDSDIKLTRFKGLSEAWSNMLPVAGGSWDAAKIEAYMRMQNLSDAFPAETNPATMIYRDTDGGATYVYFDSKVAGAEEALKEQLPSPKTPHTFTTPLYPVETTTEEVVPEI